MKQKIANIVENIDKNSKILVTGGLGFIGSNMVKRLNSLGFNNIDIIDDLTEENQGLAVELNFNNLYGKREDLPTVFRWEPNVFGNTIGTCKYSYIYHFGANSSTNSCFQDCNRWNYEYTKELIKLSTCAKKVVITSSAAVYQNDFSDGLENLQTLRPKSNYAISKLLIDKYLYNNKFFNEGRFISIRPFNVLGRGEAHKGNMASYVYQCFKKINSGDDKLTVFKFGDKFPCRDFVSIEDAIDKTLILSFSENSKGIYNIGSGFSLDWANYAIIIRDKLVDLFGRDVSICFEDKNIGDLGLNYQMETCSDNSKINSEFGLENNNFDRLKEQIEDYLEYLFKNEVNPVKKTRERPKFPENKMMREAALATPPEMIV